MKNYYWSILVHIILLLILIFSWDTIPEPKPDAVFAIEVDFSQSDNDLKEDDSNKPEKSPVTKPAAPSSQQSSVSEKTNPPKAPDNKAKPENSKSSKKSVEPVKTYDHEKALIEDQKVKQQKLQQEKLRQEELERVERERQESERREKEKNEKVSFFTNLLNKSKKADASENEGTENINHSSNGNSSQEASTLASVKGANIEGFQGTRKVIKVPVINDNSQKQGRVVVNICVDAKGKVVSSKYTQIGSTTTDPYLVKLAEEGASGYIFSPSSQSKECGRVIIEFRLRA